MRVENAHLLPDSVCCLGSVVYLRLNSKTENNVVVVDIIIVAIIDK